MPGIKRILSVSSCSLTLLTVGLAATSAAAYADPSTVLGHVYINDNTTCANTSRASIAMPTARFADRRLPFAAGGAGAASARRVRSSHQRRALPARGRRGQQPDLGSPSPAQWCAAARQRTRILQRRRPSEHRHLGASGLRRQRRSRRDQLHRLLPVTRRQPASLSNSTIALPEGIGAGTMCCSTRAARDSSVHAGRRASQIESFDVARTAASPRRSGLTIQPWSGPRPDRQQSTAQSTPNSCLSAMRTTGPGASGTFLLMR